ncbi:Peptidase family M50 [Enhygromyxa salina]|uniref:Peptidase family M50 n=1 Tax=Enhygromyxa salina TaxID=215803 RepID=A0A2S9YHC2_9BACT|nr:site-2 protease family protein [Enhygromyxa salina]PRQ04507.1 Peptidase family M50 [Enhygromyxa salina]
MFTAEPQPTKFDVHFSIGKIPVRVHPMFWLISIVFGAVAVRGASVNIFVGMALWTAAVFVSILVHELGHAITAKAYGWPPRIVLHSMGGLAIFSPTRQSRKERILIDFMGPGAGFIFGGLVLAGVLLSGHSAQLLPGIGIGSGPDIRAGGGRLELFVIFLIFVNIFWGLINLLPVQPLDGGHIAKAILEKYRPRDSWAAALKLGIGTAAVVAVAGLIVTGDYFIAIMFALLGYNNFQMLQQVQGR